jgi:hypothetical protein
VFERNPDVAPYTSPNDPRFQVFKRAQSMDIIVRNRNLNKRKKNNENTLIYSSIKFFL